MWMPRWFRAAAQKLEDVHNDVRQVRLELDFIRTHMSSYVGDGIALTYLADATPIYVNANDVGCPFNLINGGKYEEENLAVLLSFVRDNTVFVDIGANVGFFTLRVAKQLGSTGRVYSFEPHPNLEQLLSRNVYINGLSEKVSCFKLALSDRNDQVSLQYPNRHLGGGTIAPPGEINGCTLVEAEARRLDDLLGPDFRCDLVKIDVEGHELDVLRGMRETIRNSPDIKILFEKLALNAGYERQIEIFFQELGFQLYSVRDDMSLAALGTDALAGWSGYALAGRPSSIGDECSRARFSVYGGQLLAPAASTPSPGILRRSASLGEMLFHGPYWLLRQGIWRFRFHGEKRGTICFFLLERFGHPVLKFILEEGQSEHVFVMPRDLMFFECAAYAASDRAEASVVRLDFVREE